MIYWMRTLLSVGFVVCLTVSSGAQLHQYVKKDRQPIKNQIEAQIDALLAQMTREEKIGQLVQWSGAFDDQGGHPVMKPERREQVRAGNVGSLLNVSGAELTREMQRVAVEESRLRIPLIFGLDVIHGYRTTMPIPLAEAASFNPRLVEQSSRIAAREASAAGIHWTFAPMVDIARDPRWGRIAEGSGEDPYLGAVMAAARVRGFQGNDLTDPTTLAACAKHYIGYGFAEGGRDYNTADISDRTLREIVVPPFQAAIEAGAVTLMSSFNEVGGEPVSGSRLYLTKLLREELGFNGFVVSDWGSIGELVQHGVAANLYEAAVRGLNAGVDMDMESGAYLKHVSSAIEKDAISEATLNEAVRRILRVKFLLGLFDNPYRGASVELEKKLFLSPDHRNHARAMARETIVLLKNDDQTLPFSREIKKVAVIGPMAEDTENPLGTWTTQLARKEDVISISQGIRLALPKAKVVAVKGCDYQGNDLIGIPAAMRVAKEADVILLAVGETRQMSGEANSRASIELPGVQEQLILKVLQAGKPTVVVVLSGRPNALERIANASKALLIAWHPGVEAGNAIAEVIFGDYNPSGKLPATFPRATGQIPLYYNHKNTGRPPDNADQYRSRYIDLSPTPLYPFGFGMSYTTFEYSNLRLSSDKMTKNGKVLASVTLTNSGSRRGQDVAQLYMRDPVADVTRPVRMLKGFQKIELEPGESKDITFEITEEELMMYNINMRRVVEPGKFEVYIGDSSIAQLQASFVYE